MKYVDGTFDKARTLLGTDVAVSLDDQVVATGRLVSVSDSGEVVLVDDMGFTHHCWPLLDISPYPQDDSGSRAVRGGA